MKCSGCLRSTRENNTIKCSLQSCGKVYCCTCVGLTAQSVAHKKQWECPVCSAAHRLGGDNTNTPVRTTDHHLNITMRKKESVQAMVSGNEVQELTAEIRRLTNELTSVKQRLEDVTQSLKACHERLESLECKVTSNENHIKQLEGKTREIDILKASIHNLQLDLNDQCQQRLRNEIELAGIPENPGENLHHIAMLSAQKVGVKIADLEIDWVKRAGPRIAKSVNSKPEILPIPVVIRFHRRTTRDEIMKAAKSRRNMNSTDLNFPGEAHKIYFNERLTKQNNISGGT